MAWFQAQRSLQPGRRSPAAGCRRRGLSRRSAGPVASFPWRRRGFWLLPALCRLAGVPGAAGRGFRCRGMVGASGWLWAFHHFFCCGRPWGLLPAGNAVSKKRAFRRFQSPEGKFRAKPEKSRHSLFSGVLRRCCGNIRQLFSGNGQPSAYGPVASSWAIWTFRSSNSSRNLNLIALTEFVSPGSFRVQSMPLSDSSSSQRARWLTCCMASV